jgi:hypothetical protein
VDLLSPVPMLKTKATSAFLEESISSCLIF